MDLLVTFPPAVGYQGTPQWFLEDNSGWTVAELCADICYAARIDGHTILIDGEQAKPGSLAVDVCRDGSHIEVTPT